MPDSFSLSRLAECILDKISVQLCNFYFGWSSANQFIGNICPFFVYYPPSLSLVDKCCRRHVQVAGKLETAPSGGVECEVLYYKACGSERRVLLRVTHYVFNVSVIQSTYYVSLKCDLCLPSWFCVCTGNLPRIHFDFNTGVHTKNQNQTLFFLFIR